MQVNLFQNKMICRFPSNQFYDGKLNTILTHWWRADGEIPNEIWPNAKAPMVFCNVEGLEETQPIATVDGNEQSKWNQKDAAKAVSFPKIINFPFR